MAADNRNEKKLVNKEIVDTLLNMYKSWVFARENYSVTIENDKLVLQNYFMNYVPEICEALKSVANLEEKLASYEELIKRSNPKLQTTAGTDVADKVQTAVVDFDAKQPLVPKEVK